MKLLFSVSIMGCAMSAALGVAMSTRRRTQTEEDEYQSMCNGTGNDRLLLDDYPSRLACKCGFLRDAEPAATSMHSLRFSNSSSSSGTPCVNGFVSTAFQEYPCSNVDLMSFLSLSELNSVYGAADGKVNDVWGWTDKETCTEIAILGMVSGTAFVDISDPVNPILLGELPSHNYVNSNWRDIKTYKDHAYIVSEAAGHGMQVFSLSQLMNVGTSNPKILFETNHYNGFGDSHNVFINEDTGFAYVVGSNQCAGGLYMIDLTTPSSPQFAGCFADDGYTHDAQCVLYKGSDEAFQGREICFACNVNTVTIIDVTDKTNPVQLSKTFYNSSKYTHQGWLTEDHDHFLFGDEYDEQKLGVNTKTLVLNTADLVNPSLGGFYTASTAAVDHNQYIVGNLTYQANYRAGLRILEIKDASTADFTEIGYFDTYPIDDDAKFNSAWSNYPYFSSGIVAVSAIEEGLFLVKPSWPSTSPQCAPQITNASSIPAPVTCGIFSKMLGLC